MMGNIVSTQGMALVLTLMVLVLITAMVTEFAYSVYTGTNTLHNWYDSQRLSVFARSGVNMASRFITGVLSGSGYTHPGYYDMDFENPSIGFEGKINLRMEDENSKFNVNTIVYSNGNINKDAYDSFSRLLSNLSIDANVADYVADWIDPDTEERLRDSEAMTKNASLYTVDELLLIKGIDKAVYEKLLPYITVYGDGLININGAEKPVLMSLSDNITDELAQRVIDYRKTTPFEEIGQLQKVAGLDLATYGPISGRITVKGRYFYVKASTMSGGIKTIIEAVVGTSGDIKYWREL